MAEKTLVDSKILESQTLLMALDQAGINPSLAVWYYYDDIEDWRLIFCGKNIDAFLPGKEALAYQAVGEQLTNLGLALSVSDIKFLSTKAPLVSALAFIVGTDADSVASIHMSNTTINGIFLQEVVILRSALRA